MDETELITVVLVSAVPVDPPPPTRLPRPPMTLRQWFRGTAGPRIRRIDADGTEREYEQH